MYVISLHLRQTLFLYYIPRRVRSTVNSKSRWYIRDANDRFELEL